MSNTTLILFKGQHSLHGGRFLELPSLHRFRFEAPPHQHINPETVRPFDERSIHIARKTSKNNFKVSCDLRRFCDVPILIPLARWLLSFDIKRTYAHGWALLSGRGLLRQTCAALFAQSASQHPVNRRNDQNGQKG